MARSKLSPGHPTGRILITGASGGLGGALARHYARPDARLLLWGRDAARLGQLADACRAAGALVATRQMDLTDTPGALAAVRQDDSDDAIGLAVLAAGLGDTAPAGGIEPAEQVWRLGLVNYVTPAAMATALGAAMAERGHGRVVLVGSVAAFHQLPYAAGYCGSKAGLLRFAQCLRLALQPRGVGVTMVSPGFIDTPMSQRLGTPRPFLLSAEQAAGRIAAASARNAAHLVTPWPFAVLRVLDAALPAAVRRQIMARLPAP